MQLTPDRSLFVGRTPVHRVYLGTTQIWPAGTPEFATLTVGGGGWVTGLAGKGDRLYARTDVGGAYRYDRPSRSWSQMIAATGVTLDPRENDYQVEALACAPSNPDVVYAAVGDGLGGRVIASTDAGRTWPVSSPRRWYVAGNEENRVAGSRLCVDPTSPQVAYFGTRKDGLHMTVDGGATWSQLATLPSTRGDGAGAGAVGVPCVLVDPASPRSSGRHQTIYASVYGVGLVKTTNGGYSWATVSPWSSAGAYVRDMVRGSDGNIVAAFYSPDPTVGEVRRVTPSNVVTEIGPKKQTWTSVAVHETDPSKIYAAPDVLTKYHSFYRTSTGTAAKPSWSVMTSFAFSADRAGAPGTWLVDKAMPSADPNLWVGQLRFVGDTLFFAEGHGVWAATGLKLEEVTWESRNAGIEELVANSILKPAGHPALSSQWDYGYIRHNDPAELPYRKDFGSGWDLAVSPTDPNFVAVVMDDHQDPSGRTYPARRASGYSTDGGATVTRFAALAAGTAPADLLFGNIAVSARNNNNLVWVPSNKTGSGSKVYYTVDRGASWAEGRLSGLSSTDALHERHVFARHILVADPTTAGTFFALGHNTYSGTAVIWKSTNRGATWDKLATTGIYGSYRYNPTLVHDGEALWAVPGDGGQGIFRSTDGRTWAARTAVQDAQRLGVGAPMPGSAHPTLFTFGTVDGDRGMFLSRDAALTWERMTNYPCENYAGIRHLAGDPEVPGKVYVALAGGNGFAVGSM